MSFLRLINLNYVDYIVMIALFALPFVLPLFAFPAASGLASATPAVFAIVAGFFINDAMSNYLRLQTLIAEEDATLISLTHAFRAAPDIDSKPVEAAIDAYLVKVLAVENIDHVAYTQNEFDALLNAIDMSVRETKSGVAADESLQSGRDRLVDISQEVTIAARSNLTFEHWLLLGILGVVVCLILLGMRDGTLVSVFAASATMVATYAILVVLRDIDNNQYLERKLAYKTANRVFHALDLPPYYAPRTPRKLMVVDEKGLYRTTGKNGEIITVNTRQATA